MKIFPRPFLRVMVVASLALLTTCGALGQEEGEELDWPRKITTEKGEIVIYQPQVETFVGDKLESRAAISVKVAGQEDMIFGAMWFESYMATNMETRMASLVRTKVTAAKFPDVEQEKVDELSRFIENEMPTWDIVISLDRLIASLPDHQGEEDNFGSEPPRIYHRTVPAVLVSIDGDPILTELNGFELEYVANSAFLIVKDKKTGFYLRGGGMWFISDDIGGSWKRTEDLPGEVAKVSQKIDEDEASQAEDQKEDASALELESNAEEPDPVIIVSTVPAELILTEGEPDFATVENTQILYLKNTENDVLMDISSQQYYALFSGRWFRAPALQSDTWEFVAFEDLPPDFKKIPAGSDMASVLGSVPGTVESREAVLETSIPQTAEIDRKTATVEVTYDGEPQFEVCGEGVAYALNTDKSVLLIDKKYYCVDSAIWFVGDGPTGPWQVATEVPAVVQDLPPDCPVYNVKYVYIYDSTPEVVYVGYTSGYYGSYVWGSCVVYGTGWYYYPWYGYYYYPHPVTYGYGVHYNPYTGWGYHYGYSYGWVSVGIVVRPYYSCWGAGGYRYGYRRGYWHGYNHGYRHGYRHGAARGYRAGYRAGHHNSHHNAYRNRNNGVKHTGDVRRDSGGTRPSTTNGGKNNVYADRNGDVYRDKDGSWEKREDGNWKEDRSRDGDPNQDRDNNRDREGTRDTQPSEKDRSERDQSSRDQGTRDQGTRDQGTRDQGTSDRSQDQQADRDRGGQSSNQQMDRDRSSRDRGNERQQQSPSRSGGGGSRRGGGGGRRR